MDHPSQLFNRVRRHKARPALGQNGRDGVAPAPIRPAAPLMQPTAEAPRPATVPPAQPAAPAENPAASPAPTPRRPPGSHALYSQIMRSHDRMGTRHL